VGRYYRYKVVMDSGYRYGRWTLDKGSGQVHTSREIWQVQLVLQAGTGIGIVWLFFTVYIITYLVWHAAIY
jgi:hypothetical protein